MNLPNKLTILRMILIVPFVACMLIPGLGDTGMYASVVIFIIASLTDLLDGKNHNHLEGGLKFPPVTCSNYDPVV